MNRFPQSVAASTGLHGLAVVLLILVMGHRPAPIPLPMPNDAFTHAIAVTLAPPPKPQPVVQPRLKPTPPRPQALPATLASQAPQALVSTPPPAVQPEPIPSPPATDQTVEPAQATYEQIVVNILKQNKRYPRAALLAGNEGTVLFSFIVNREGTVLAYTIEQSTDPVFDEEVKRLVHSVRFPPFPASDRSERKNLEVSLEFRLGG
jgi:protein TonB